MSLPIALQISNLSQDIWSLYKQSIYSPKSKKILNALEKKLNELEALIPQARQELEKLRQ
jgi:hypothetical protein